MFRSLLIANRGEIACRIIATARRMGLRTVAVYSDADAGARHVREADDAVRIGPAAARESYLVVDRIIDAARKSGAEAIHPGYGFLSENPALAEACLAAGIVFVGPSPSSIRTMGSKAAAKALMEKARVPTTPGYHGDEQSPRKLADEAARIGYPVLIKATNGGGGKGMRRVDRPADFDAALASCQREARAAFDSDLVLLEKYVERPRHVEVQVFGDTHGNHVHLFERDCSVQRRHQKVLEEAPAPGLSDAIRAKLGETAVLAAKAVSYVGAGTVEFIVDREATTFYFMEMNTRLQVEHPVTEQITGLDLVEWQLRVAAGERLPLAQDQITRHGHSIEARIYAENPDAGFTPSIGRLVHLRPPQASSKVRVDTGVEQGDEITPHYDPMIAKLIVTGADREEALRQMQTALQAYEVVGVANNIELLGRLVRTASFSKPDLDTSLMEREHDALFPPPATIADDVFLFGAIAELAHSARPTVIDSPWSRLDGWRLGSQAPHTVTLKHGDDRREIRAEYFAPGDYALRVSTAGSAQATAATRAVFRPGPDHTIRVDLGERATHFTAVPVPLPHGSRWSVFVHGRRWDLDVVDPLYVEASTDESGAGLKATMPGKVIAHLVPADSKVTKGTPLMVLEAMKMELTVAAPRDGRLVSFRYAPGEQVAEGAELAVFEDAP